jgi:uncharacterized membrane protein (DUF2068 family)
MRSTGVALIAILNWVRAALFAFVGMVLILLGHFSGRLMAAMEAGPLAEHLLSGVGKLFGFGFLLIAVVWLAAGVGLWALKSWGRTLTMAVTGLWLVLGLLGLLHHPFPTPILRVVIDVAVLVYLSMPEVQQRFARG